MYANKREILFVKCQNTVGYILIDYIRQRWNT